MDRVLIVGGGPAGLATAIVLAQQNISTLVIEKNTWPKDKVCGEGLMPPGVDFLNKYKIKDKLPEDGFYSFSGIRYIDQNITAQASFKSGVGMGIRRLHLSSALLARAKDFSNIEIMDHTKLQDFSIADGVSVTILRQGIATLLPEKFALIIGADGLHSRVRKIAHLEGTPPGRRIRWGGRQHFAVAPWSKYVEIRWHKGIEAYATPSGKNRVEIAFLWDQTQIQPHKKDWFSHMLALFPDLEKKVNGKVSLSKPQGIGPLAVAARTAVKDHLVLIGDAQLYLDGITGEGISMAFVQAEILGQHLPPLIQNHTLKSEDLKPLLKEFAKETKRYITLTSIALFFTRHPFIRRCAMRALSRSSIFFQHFLEANLGTKPLWCFPIHKFWQLLWGLAYPKTITRNNISNNHVKPNIEQSSI